MERTAGVPEDHRFQAQNAVGQGKLYVTRPADEAYIEGIRAGRDTHLLGSRMAGKSSMMRHAARVLGDAMTFVYVDLRAVMLAGGSPADWMSAILFAACSELDDRASWAEWRARWGDSPLLRDMFLEIVGHAPDHRLVCVQLDEFDKLREPDAKEAALSLLAGLRGLKDSSTVLADRLLLSVATVRMPSRLIDNTEGAPTELPGTYVRIGDFPLDADTVAQVANGFPPKYRGAAMLAEAALRFSGGYAQLTTFLCRRLIEDEIEPDADHDQWFRAEIARLRAAPAEAKDFIDQCDRFIDSQRRDLARDAVYAYRRVLRGEWLPFDGRDPAVELLVHAGIVVPKSGTVALRGAFLSTYYDEVWVERKLRALAESAPAPTPLRPRKYQARVCILHTGGTIGMLEHADGNVRTPDNIEDLRAKFAEANDLMAVEWNTIMSVDSANVGPGDWSVIADAIYARRNDYDGFVVAHGTDTLAFSASAVAFALGPGLDFPVVFTGSQTTADVGHGDARSNLLRSCLVAAQGPRLPEVVICFDEFVYRGVRCTKRDDRRFSAFESPTYPALAVVTEDVDLQSEVIRVVPRGSEGIDLRPRFNTGILVVAQTPGSYSEFFEAALDQLDTTVGPTGEESQRRRCRGVILQSLGAGNIPTTPAHSLVPLIRAARARDVPVVLTSLYPVHTRNLARYSPVLAATEAGAIPVANMTTAAAVAKLSWVLAQAEERYGDGDPTRLAVTDFVADRMTTDYVGELGELELATDT